MRKHRIMLTAAILALTLLVSCTDRKKNQGRVTLTFWHSFVSSTLPALEDLISRFESEYPAIHIQAQYVPTGDALSQKLITAIQSRTAPDISWIHSDFIQQLVEADAIHPVWTFIEGPEGMTPAELEDIFPALLRAGEWRGTLYALPMEATSLALLYNRDLFRQAGLDPDHPPANWNELYEYALKMTVDGDNDGKTDQYGFYVPVFSASGPLSIWMVLQWTPFLWQAGGEFINRDQTRILFNSEAGVQALTLWKQLYDAMDFRTFSMAHDLAFFSRHLAMVMDGPWNLPRYRQLSGVDWAVAPLPTGPVKQATYLAGEELAIFKQSKHAQEAWIFVKWILQPEQQAFFSIRSGYLPVRRSVLELDSYRDHLAVDAPLRVFVEQMKHGQARETIDYNRIAINQTIAEAVEKCLAGGMEPKQALDEAAAKANRLLQP
ncbi:MAG TPA: ABC transporter substrate-binding protein [bacterium]|nr:ABC transporter substrate-binding protein [bacterium]